MAHPERFERPTPRFVVWCSIQLSYGRAWRAPHRQAPTAWQSLNHPFCKQLCRQRDIERGRTQGQGPADALTAGVGDRVPADVTATDRAAPARRLPPDGEEAERIVARAHMGAAVVESVEARQHRIPPAQLYDLTELQRHANRLFGNIPYLIG